MRTHDVPVTRCNRQAAQSLRRWLFSCCCHAQHAQETLATNAVHLERQLSQDFAQTCAPEQCAECQRGPFRFSSTVALHTIPTRWIYQLPLPPATVPPRVHFDPSGKTIPLPSHFTTTCFGPGIPDLERSMVSSLESLPGADSFASQNLSSSPREHPFRVFATRFSRAISAAEKPGQLLETDAAIFGNLIC